MSDDNNAGAGLQKGGDDASQSAKKWAGKWDSPEEMIQGTREAIRRIVPDISDEQIAGFDVGQGKRFADHSTFEAYARTIQSSLGALSPLIKPEADSKQAGNAADSATKPDTKANAGADTKADANSSNDGIDGLLLGKATENNVDVDAMDWDALLNHAGLSDKSKLSEYAKHFADKSELHPDVAAAMKRINVPKAVATRLMRLEMDAAAASTEQLIATSRSEAERAVGGPDKLKAVHKWATTGGISPEELKTINDSIRANPRIYATVMAGLAVRYTALSGDDGGGIRGMGSGAGGGASSRPWTEVLARANAGDPEAKAEMGRRAKQGRLPTI